tara:strand:+ start:748 stop:2943 length:2196 start_codon:yes stop_codon:yes gene_type:complete
MKLEIFSNLLKELLFILLIMNINTVGNALTFRKSVVAQINEKGIGPIITEHLPDDMHHGDHKKAIIYKTTKGIVIAFENTISKYNWENLNTKNCLNKLHKIGETIDTHGEGLQNLFSIAKTIILFNFDETNNKITVKELEYGKFFKEIETYEGNDSSHLAQKWSKETIYDLNDKDEYNDDGYEKFKNTEIFKEFESQEGKFIKWKFKFGYLVHFEMNKKAPNYNEQQKFLNLLHKFVDDKCPEIRTKNSQSPYKIQTLCKLTNLWSGLNFDAPSHLITLEKDDPIKFEHRKLHLECQIHFFKHKTESGKIQDKFIAFFPTLNINKLYTRNLTSSQWEGTEGKLVTENKGYFMDNGSFKWDIKLDIFQINTKYYNQATDSEKYGWIVLQMQNGEKILVNLTPIDIGFVGTKYTNYCNDYRKSLRIVTTIKDMKFSHSDGLKPESKWKDKTKKAIKCIFKDVHEKSHDFNKYHKKTEAAPLNISFDPHNSFDVNIVRKSQSKAEKKKRSVKKQTKLLNKNRDITKIKTTVRKEVKKINKKIIMKKQTKRHNKPGGFLYVFQHPNWRKEGIVKFGVAEDWEKRLQQHQRSHPIKRIKLLLLIELPHNAEKFEDMILALFQNEGIQYNTHATTRSEYVRIGNLDFEKSKAFEIINTNLPQNMVNKDVELWNNVTISDEDAEQEYTDNKNDCVKDEQVKAEEEANRKTQEEKEEQFFYEKDGFPEGVDPMVVITDN